VGLSSDDWKALRAGELSRYSASEQAALRYAEKLTQTPGEIRGVDIDELKRHFRDEQIVDLHLLIGLANLTNRFTGPLGFESE
jgi:alkylhydroperoxidase family enzyme